VEQRKLGRSGLKTSAIMFGGNVFGWTVSEKDTLNLLDAAVAAGITAIDTADVYSIFVPGNVGGESETAIGKWLQTRGGRDKVMIASKCGMPMGAGMSGLGRAWIERAVELSLKRLQTDYIDLYQAHRDDPDTPLEETLAAFDSLIRAGKVRAIGASNYSSVRLRQSLEFSATRGVARFETLQPLYNLYDRAGFEGPLEELCRREEIGVITYFSLAAGFLSGKYRTRADFSRSLRGPRLEKYLSVRGLRVIAALWEVANRRGSTPAQVAIAWLLSRRSVTAPIVSATSLDQLATMVAATELQLHTDELQLLTAASERRADDGPETSTAH
jgi:aryl-alcohol dehydrogenase-like predicted oxidoreductase